MAEFESGAPPLAPHHISKLSPTMTAPAAPMSFSPKLLFGGAITAYMPEGLLDVS